MDYGIIFMSVLFIWYVGFILFSFHLYFRHYKKYPYTSLKEEKDVPEIISLPKLSILLYHRMSSSLFISTVYFLIYKEVFKITTDELDSYIELSAVKINLSDSQKAVINLLIKVIGDDHKVGFHDINDYCNGKYGKGEFAFNCDMWRRSLVKEGSWKDYYEVIECYSVANFISIASIVLALINFIFGFYYAAAYLPVILSYFMMVLFFKAGRRTVKANDLYYRWMSFRDYLVKSEKIKVKDEKKYMFLVYGTLLKVKNLPKKLNMKNADELLRINDMISKCLKESKVSGKQKCLTK